jgi:hypothetical protein
MASPFSQATKSLHEQAIEAIIQATDAATRNEQGRVKMLTQQAQMFAELIARKMKAMGMHRQAEEYLKALTDHINRVWVISERIHANETRELVNKARKAIYRMRKAGEDCKKCKKTVQKDGSCSCGMLDKSETSPHNKHDYKMMHELSAKHQKDIQKKYPQGDHSRYAYPIHKDSGDLVQGPRMPLPPGQALRARAHSFDQLKPEHRRGSFVQIEAPGHASHGKKGVVLGPNPHLPNKIGVQIGPSEHHSIWVEPREVKISRAITKVEKAIQTLFNIRKAFLK